MIYRTIKRSLDAKANKGKIDIYNIAEDKHIKAHKRTLISSVVVIKMYAYDMKLLLHYTFVGFIDSLTAVTAAVGGH